MEYNESTFNKLSPPIDLVHFLCKTDKGWIFGYYTIILSGIKEDFQRGVSTAGQFASSFHMSARTNLHSDPEYRIYSSLKQVSLCACLIAGVSLCCIYAPLNTILNFFPLKMALISGYLSTFISHVNNAI